MMSRDVTVSPVRSRSRARVEDSSSNKEISGQKNNIGSDVTVPADAGPIPEHLRHKQLSPRQELETVLDAERAQAVVDHRQRLRKPLTAHAAKLLARKIGQAPDPNAAADMMIEKGWQGFELAWMETARMNGHSTGPPGRDSPIVAEVGMASDMIREWEIEQERKRNGSGGISGN